MYRSHRCGEIDEIFIGKSVIVSGWVNSVRDHGGMSFVDLRDETGVVQLVFKTEKVEKLGKEFVIRAKGIVKKRSDDLINLRISTGSLEIEVNNMEVLSKCDALPFEIGNCRDVKEELRLKYRFLDLRSKSIHDNIILRSEVIHFLRNKMRKLGFIEIQTPILTSSSPEGARDYVIPSRKHRGKFYALPQAPQIFKQLLMVSGFDRYYQIAPCFRDEDSRADRSPGEFYQLDFEMAFAEQDDVLKVAEDIFFDLFLNFKKDSKVTSPPFVRIPYNEAIKKFGTDKPDLRNPLTINDVSCVFRDSNSMLFNNKFVKTICISDSVLNGFVKVSSLKRSFFDLMNKFAIENEMNGLGYVKLDKNMNIIGPMAKFIPEMKRSDFFKLSQISSNDLVFFVADSNNDKSLFLAGKIRNKLGEELHLIDKNSFEFCFVTDFPMFEKDENGKIVFKHNPFSMPRIVDYDNPLEIFAYQYDIVCNGVEISSGAVRNHSLNSLVEMFEIAGYEKKDIILNFPALYRAFSYGVPPHAGMAPGIERIVMLLTDSQSVKDVVAFPMNGNAQDLLMDAPAYIREEQLKELHIRLI